MKALYEKAYNLYRRRFGTYRLEDPRPRALDSRYTFYLPSEARTNGVRPGDNVKLIIVSRPASWKYCGERMWVAVTEVRSDRIVGKLDNDPFDIPQLIAGDRIEFQPFHIIEIQTERDLPEESEKQKQYWDRCMVDRCVLDEGVPVYYIYREEPDMGTPDDENPDSGWRIRGDYRKLTEEALEARKVSYIALGKVLNVDDSWLHLIDAPIGSAFMRNFDTGEYTPCEQGVADDKG